MAIPFSIVVPVYNRPDELEELLRSIDSQRYTNPLEIVIVEDGSTLPAKDVVKAFDGRLNITYLEKPNSGPGASRNLGMEKAMYDYFIILDSDCILADRYLENVQNALQSKYADCFGGPDAAHESFSELQKAINFSMTSFITTGGIRGSERAVSTFEPRSFNMGLSREAFEATGGFGRIHPGEDPDLVWRVRKAGFKTRFIKNALVYHKRRIDFGKFYKQVHKFGKVRPILNRWHPESRRFTHWLPTLFLLVLLLIPLLLLGKFYLPAIWIGVGLLIYILAIVSGGLYSTGLMSVGFLAVIATFIQFTGYGWGFLKSVILLNFSRKQPPDLFPELFFKR